MGPAWARGGEKEGLGVDRIGGLKSAPGSGTGGMDSSIPGGRLLQRSTFKGKEGEGPRTQGFKSFCAWKPLPPHPQPHSRPPAACSPPRAEGGGAPDPGSEESGCGPTRSALVFTQLEPYMDENFISRAFATMGETVMSVKIIRNRLTGFVLLLQSKFYFIDRAACVIQEKVNIAEGQGFDL